MTEAHSKKPSAFLTTVIAFVAIAILLSTIAVNGINKAQADSDMVKLEDHWKYSVSWYWDPQFQRTMGLITPKIIIANETADKITGYIADANGTRLTMYDEEHIIMTKYAYDNGLVTKWSLAGKMHDGWFTIDIPTQYRDAQTVSIYITNHMYVVALDDSTISPPRVFINSARLDFRTNSTLDAINESPATTQIAQQQSCLNPSGSLIDYILSTVRYSNNASMTTTTASTCKTL